MNAAVQKRSYGPLIGWGLLAFVGALVFIATSAYCYGWAITPYEQREFTPYHTPLAQVIPGYSFSPGHPHVAVSYEQFVQESAGQPFIMSFSPEWLTKKLYWERRHNSVYQVNYSMKKSTPAGEIYLTSSIMIPNYYDKGTVGFSEQVAYDPKRVAFFSTNEGTSYWAFVPMILFWLVSIVVMLLAGITARDEYECWHKYT